MLGSSVGDFRDWWLRLGGFTRGICEFSFRLLLLVDGVAPYVAVDCCVRLENGFDKRDRREVGVEVR